MSQHILLPTASQPCSYLGYLVTNFISLSISQTWLQDVPQHSTQPDATDGPELAREKSLLLDLLIWSPDIRWRMLMEYLLYICIAHTDSKEKSDYAFKRSSVASHPYNPHASTLSVPARLWHSSVPQSHSSPTLQPPEWCSRPSGTISPAFAHQLLWPGATSSSYLQQWFSNFSRLQGLVKTQMASGPP